MQQTPPSQINPLAEGIVIAGMLEELQVFIIVTIIRRADYHHYPQ